MVSVLALASLLAAAQGATGASACLPAPPAPGPGVADPFRAPDPKATALNADGKVLYRQGKWDDARAQYRAAEAADPTFLAPRLNVACSFVRQERFNEAVAEVKALLDLAFVPWSREVLEAADLGALKVQPQMAEVKRALTAGAVAWGAGLDEAVIFVGRQRAPLRVPPDGAGEFILNAHQEVFAFSPATGRYRQLTAQDGHVVAVAVAPDRRRVVFVTAEKLIRGARRDDVTLDGVALGELTLATMTLGPPVPIPGGIRRLEIGGTPHGFAFRIDGPRMSGRFVVGAAGALVPIGGGRPPGPPLAVLTATGALPAGPSVVAGACAVTARDVPSAGGGRTVSVSARGRPARTLGGAFGAGLAGLPLP
ncbi:MAG TPA: hypothetical protein VKZ18_08025 [Polyangia bacterium]|nr:hypothetical protein [Polyangia bacterium]